MSPPDLPFPMSPSNAGASTPALFTRKWVIACGLAAVAAGLVFAVAPALDLDAASAFYLGEGRFAGQGPWGNRFRALFYWLPVALFAGSVASYLARRAGLRVAWAPSARGVLFLALSLALGPGLLVNAVLKEQSHRPRPVQVSEFGGDSAFRPFYRFDGACRHNCSFVSGEGSTAFWCIAPALLAPPGVRAAATAAAVLFGVAASVLRMAFGGHFLSDTVFAALFTWLAAAAAWHLVYGRAER